LYEIVRGLIAKKPSSGANEKSTRLKPLMTKTLLTKISPNKNIGISRVALKSTPSKSYFKPSASKNSQLHLNNKENLEFNSSDARMKSYDQAPLHSRVSNSSSLKSPKAGTNLSPQL